MEDKVSAVEIEKASAVEIEKATPEDVAASEVDPMDELKDLDFLLEDIEDKIAPLALSAPC